MSSLLEQLKQRAGDKEGPGRGVILALIVSVLVSIAVALFLVWLNMERTKLAYRAHSLQREVDRVMESNAKLEVERNFLISPQELSKKAEAMGLRPALPGEIRRMGPVRPSAPTAGE
jgi:hypothetical protein